MGIVHLETFILAVIIFAITPGVDTIYILNRTITQGRPAGLYSTFGILSGVLVHTTLAAFGLSVILAKSAAVFSMVKYMGAAYLFYLGIAKLFFSRDSISDKIKTSKKESMLKIYTSGVIANVLNPKVALFFLAFFPQFVDPSYKGAISPFISLGIIYIIIDLIWCILLTIGASFFAHKVINNEKTGLWMNKISGGIFILLGLKIALIKRVS